MCSIDVPEVADLQDLGPRELASALAGLDRVRRRVEALIGEAVGVAERSVAYAEDGHASVTGFVKATCNWSGGESKAMVQCSRLMAASPEVRAAAHAGKLGVAQTRLLAKVFANPRCAAQFPASAGLLVDHATELWFDEFAVVVRRWEALADVDGAHRAHERAHSGLDAHVSVVDEHVYLDARGGVAAGAVIEEIFERFCDLEFRADWDAGVTRWGERMNPGLLDRSAAQRRFDALLEVFLAAAVSGTVGQFDPLVNIIADPDHPRPPPHPHDRRQPRTVRSHQRRPTALRNVTRVSARPRRPPRRRPGGSGSASDARQSRSGDRSLGRRSRLFTGGARDAVLLGDRWCIWPGCDLRSGRCQTDHTQPWATAGPTRPANGSPACARHNRWKHQHGYRTWRDPNGHWHTYRPDGTELGHPDASQRGDAA